MRVRAPLLILLAALGLAGCDLPFPQPSSSSTPGHLAVLEQGVAQAESRSRLRDPASLPIPQPGGPCRMRRCPPVSPEPDDQLKPILFVLQVPTRGDEFASRGSTFANHIPSIGSTPRGGDLMLRYPDGTLRNLTREAGFGMEGFQGENAIAVREPSVHWDGEKALFSMVVGAPERYSHHTNPWQMYEVTGLKQNQQAVITKVPHQPANYNNVSPIYTSDDKILFTSDRPRDNQAHLHPQLDEYESTPTIVGIYKLDPGSGQVQLLNHTPSGAFSPEIDASGRVVFIRWDHLQRDQQHDAGYHGAVNFANESPQAGATAAGDELFPEHRLGSSSVYGPVNGFTYNLFAPWEINQDGTHEQSLNHMGRQELSFGYIGKSFAADNHLQDNTGSAPRQNTFFVRGDGGLFTMREDPNRPGDYYAVYAREFYDLSAGQILRMKSPVGLDAEKMTIDALTPSSGAGRWRNPLPLSTGGVVAAHIPHDTVPSHRNFPVRLRALTLNQERNQLVPGDYLTPGIVKSVSWWDPDARQDFSGQLWELEPVEVRARPRPPMPTLAITGPESQVFKQEGVDESQFRQWLKERNLSLIVVRNQTQRDRGERQQPFNLRVPGGVSTVATPGTLYDIAHFQLFQANLVRSYQSLGQGGRRVLAQHVNLAHNPAHTGPAGSVVIAADGSSAAIVPANRALTWQTINPNGVPVVRERLWVTFQPGEIRTCSGCHGTNVAHQAGGPPATTQPQALRNLLRHWKASQQSTQAPIKLRR